MPWTPKSMIYPHLQIQNSKELTTKYLLFLTCHRQDTWAKRNYFTLSSLLRLPVNKAMGTNCYHDCLLGKEKKKNFFLNQHFPYTGSHFRNLCWDPPTISNSDHYLSGLDLNWFIAQTKQVIYVRWIEAYHRETWRKEMELLAVVHIKGQRWIYAIGILCWKSAGKSSTDLGMLLWRGNRAPSCNVLNWGGQCLRKAQERVILT